MRSYIKFIAVATVSVVALACSNAPTEPPYGQGGGSSSGSSGQGGIGGDGGQGGEGGIIGIRDCVTSGDCRGRYKTCEVELCWEGKCEAFYDALGVVCDPHTDPLAMCDGMGHCGSWDRSECFVPMPLDNECPLCDDGDPATADTCVNSENGTPLEIPYCTHSPIKEGWNCGQAFTIQNGKCCPLD